jgi:predicted DNA-binding transcriptional regulator YafY
MANPFANSIKFLTALNLLASPSGATIKKLMEHLNVSRRTAFRLLEALEGLGFPLVDAQPKQGTEKTYRLMDSYVLKLPNMTIPNPGLTAQEIELVLTMLDFCEKLQQIGHSPKLALIRQKITMMARKTPAESENGDASSTKGL